MVLRRWWLVLGLLVSVGVNVGVLATLAIARLTAGPAPVAGAAAQVGETGAENGTEATGSGAQAMSLEADATGTETGAAGAGSESFGPAGTGGLAGEGQSRPAPPETPSGGPEAASGGRAADDALGRRPPPAGAGSSTSIAGSGNRPASPAAREEPTAGELPPEPSDLPGPGALPQALAPRLERLADHLGLEGPTRARFIALQREMFATVLASERRRLRLQVELRRELIGPSPDADRVQKLIRRQAAQHAEAEAATARAILESRRLLDPDQERRYLAIVAQLGPRLRQEAVRRWRENRPGARPLPGRRRPR